MSAGPTTLLWVRHGQARAADGSYDDQTPLSPLGIEQAAAAPAGLGETRPSALYSSPLVRARETAASIADAFALDVQLDPRLAEFAMPVETLAGLEARPNRQQWRATDQGTTGGETAAAFHRRVVAFCDDVVDRHPAARVVIVAHVGVIDAALRWAVGLGADAPWLHELPCVSNGSVTEFRRWPRGAVEGGPAPFTAIVRLGDSAHLGGATTPW